MIEFTKYEFITILAPMLLGLLALGSLVLDMTFWREKPKLIGTFTLIGLVFIFFALIVVQVHFLNGTTVPQRLVFAGQLSLDLFGSVFIYIFIGAAIFATLSAFTYMDDNDNHHAEYYILLTIATIGMCLMAISNDLLLLFIGLETMSIPIYVLVGIDRKNIKSNEASVKYLLLGAFASAIMLYGMALIYGMTGNLGYSGIYDGMFEMLNVQNGSNNHLVLMIGFGLMLVGLFFKVAAVPFHMWTPDVYEGAPTPITAYMATGVKAAAFAAMLRFIIEIPGLWIVQSEKLFIICSVLAVLTMTIGNVTAIAQTNIKRMLAFSSIAHAGYLLIGITTIFTMSSVYAGPEFIDSAETAVLLVRNSGAAILFYLIAYTFTNLGAFGVIIMLSREKEDGETLDGFAGIGTSRPGLAAVMAICMLSLAGIPPLVGFTAKFQIFQTAVSGGLYTIAIIGVLNSVVSAYFYLRVLVFMYMTPEKVPFKNDTELISGVSVANIVMAIAVVTLGLFPKVVIELVSKTISSIQIF